MEKLEESLKEIFEVSELDKNLKLTDMEEWDSLSSLSIIAMLEADYGIEITIAQLGQFESISVFIDFVNANKR